MYYNEEERDRMIAQLIVRLLSGVLVIAAIVVLLVVML